jgi:hypothetical protein
MLLIGDVHCKIDEYKKIIDQNNNTDSIVLGDFGFKQSHDWFINNQDIMIHKVLFGNHDYYPYVHYQHPLGDFGIYKNLFFIRGAITPAMDLYHRMYLNKYYFLEEQLSKEELENALELYIKTKPEIVISHDCPMLIKRLWFNYDDETRTNLMFDKFFENWKPKFWYFGHYHFSKKEIINNCTFQCLGELKTVMI